MQNGQEVFTAMVALKKRHGAFPDTVIRRARHKSGLLLDFDI